MRGFVRDGAELAMLEMLQGGTTCFNDMYFFPDVIARAVDASGLRACVGMIVLEQATVWARDADEYLRKGLAARDQFRGHPRVSMIFAPHAPYTVADDSFREIRLLANELDTQIHMHVHETASEISASQKRHARRPLQRLDELGLLTPLLAAVHMTQLTAGEISLLASRGVSVVHCPESNLKLASGFCPIADLAAAGINIALGTDGASSNNDLDMFGEMRSCALLAKGVAQRADVGTGRSGTRHGNAQWRKGTGPRRPYRLAGDRQGGRRDLCRLVGGGYPAGLRSGFTAGLCNFARSGQRCLGSRPAIAR